MPSHSRYHLSWRLTLGRANLLATLLWLLTLLLLLLLLFPLVELPHVQREGKAAAAAAEIVEEGNCIDYLPFLPCMQPLVRFDPS